MWFLILLIVGVLLLVGIGVLGFTLLTAVGSAIIGVGKWLIMLPITYWYLVVPLLLVAFVVWMYRSGANSH